MAGLGKTVTVLANLDGKNTFKLENFMLVTDDAFKRHHANFWQEKIFLSDHGEIPKVISYLILVVWTYVYFKDWRSIRTAVLKSVGEVRAEGRSVDRIFMVTDTGGENWGSQVLVFSCNQHAAQIVAMSHTHASKV